MTGSSREIAGPRPGAKKVNIESETSFCVRKPESGPSEKITEVSLKGLPAGKSGKISASKFIHSNDYIVH